MRANVTDNNLSYVWPWGKVYPPSSWREPDVPTEDTFLAIGAEESSFSTKLLQSRLTLRGSVGKTIWIEWANLPIFAVVLKLE